MGEQIIKCSSCHSGCHTYCMEAETAWDPKQNNTEYFCQKCIGDQISHLHTRRSQRLKNKSPTKSATTKRLQTNYKNDVISSSEETEDDDVSSNKSSISSSEEIKKESKTPKNRKRKRQNSLSSDDAVDGIENVKEPKTKKRKLSEMNDSQTTSSSSQIIPSDPSDAPLLLSPCIDSHKLADNLSVNHQKIMSDPKLVRIPKRSVCSNNEKNAKDISNQYNLLQIKYDTLQRKYDQLKIEKDAFQKKYNDAVQSMIGFKNAILKLAESWKKNLI